MERELDYLERVLEPERPFAIILGGAKVSDKIGVIHRLLDRVDTLFIGGGMAYTFLSAQGIGIGKSLLEPDKVKDAQELLELHGEGDVLQHLVEPRLAANRAAAAPPRS